MKHFKCIAIFMMATSAHAGFNGLTSHSRANCLTINESISWDATRQWDIKIYAHHKHWAGGAGSSLLDAHHIYPPEAGERTRRSAAIHYGEARNKNWEVMGDHYIYTNGKMILHAETQATDCSAYDGWWDQDHPERKS